MSKPCRECPFSRTAPRGWLGAHESSREIVDIVYSDRKFPCHMEVTKLTEKVPRVDFIEATFTAAHCVGALAFMNNSAKRSRDRGIANLQQAVGPLKSVFNSPTEMKKHHGR